MGAAELHHRDAHQARGEGAGQVRSGEHFQTVYIGIYRILTSLILILIDKDDDIIITNFEMLRF